jgi:hypothetical protein
MAANKAKRSVHLAQPQRPRLHPEPAELKPVKARVYRDIAEMNTGLEQALHGLRALQHIPLFPADDLNNLHNQLSRIRAQANRQLVAVLEDREASNAAHFHRLCLVPRTGHPDVPNR